MSKRPYDDNLYRFDTPQESYWEATAEAPRFDAAPVASDEYCDVAIVGGGYTGLSAALHLARDYQLDVRVLEAGHIGWGASGRNGGFCCPGGTGLHSTHFAKYIGIDAFREYYNAQVEAVELVRDLVADEGLDVDAQGDCEFEVAHTPAAMRRLSKEHALLHGELGLDYELIDAAECRERFYDSTEQHGALIARPAFGLHALRYCRGLAEAATRKGARLHERSRVVEWAKRSDGTHRLVTKGGSVSAKRVLYATNGFMDESLNADFAARIVPVISAIVVTRPLTDAELAEQRWVTDSPAINSRRILNYFRLLPDKRFLFGGRGAARGTKSDEAKVYVGLQELIGKIWPAWSGVEVDYRWHGLVCMTRRLCPTVGQLNDDPSVYFGFGYHGNGVNNASWTGKQMADWIGNGRQPESVPAVITGLSERYPLPSLRQSYLRFGIFVSRQLDRFT
ncbi:MAG: FAD-dependent oxidoreductase [Pseudomonadota bacterium]